MGCGVEGSFTLSALAEDGTKIGSETVDFETAPCALPDLVVTSAQAMPGTGKAPYFTTVTVAVKNQGSSVAAGPFKVT